ncbi:MAG: hypothetical protein R2748_34150 [Bryobacterales bacterium]
MTNRFAIALSLALAPAMLVAQAPAPEYQIYGGSTHAHTSHTWSHGAHLDTNGCKGILVYGPDKDSPDAFSWTKGYVTGDGCPAIYVVNGAQLPAPGVTVKADWQEHQGPPSEHYRLAKKAGYDFYVTADHSQEAGFQPPAADNPQWMAAKQQAADATVDGFVALAGFEYSENDGPGGKGHFNVINADGISNALAPGVDLPAFYEWLGKARTNGEGPVVATFNHPGPDQYADWAGRTPEATEVLTMLEVINSNRRIHYEGFLSALDHGWKVSPVAGNDNHGTRSIATNTARTFVLATEPTKAAILDGMKNRRTYAAMDHNLECRYAVNGAVMGSTLNKPDELRFDILVSDPDLDDPREKITKIDIVKDDGAVVEEFTPKAAYTVRWRPEIRDAEAKYFFVRVWTAGGGDAEGADPNDPTAWLAPVWTGR